MEILPVVIHTHSFFFTFLSSLLAVPLPVCVSFLSFSSCPALSLPVCPPPTFPLLQPVALSDREVISRLRNCILALAAHKVMLFDTSVLYCYESALPHQVNGLLHVVLTMRNNAHSMQSSSFGSLTVWIPSLNAFIQQIFSIYSQSDL